MFGHWFNSTAVVLAVASPLMLCSCTASSHRVGDSTAFIKASPAALSLEPVRVSATVADLGPRNILPTKQEFGLNRLSLSHNVGDRTVSHPLPIFQNRTAEAADTSEIVFARGRTNDQQPADIGNVPESLIPNGVTAPTDDSLLTKPNSSTASKN
jgi:hypothetical protein